MPDIDNKNTLVRYSLFFIIIFAICALIVYQSFVIIFRENEKWLSKAPLPKEKVLKGERGSIYSSDGYLLAATVPEYRITIDMFAGGFNPDTLTKYLPRISKMLAKEVGDRTANQYTEYINDAIKEATKKDASKEELIRLKRKYRNYPITQVYIGLSVRERIFTDPYFKLPRAKSGIKTEKRYRRENPHGFLASRTIGIIEKSGTESIGRAGLEMYYNDELSGTPGLGFEQRAMGENIVNIVTPPINGMNVISTIDMAMQEITTHTLLRKLKEFDADMGIAVVMEVKTGAIRAIANLDKSEKDGKYYERANHALASIEQPGSTIKTASFLVGLDDGKINLNTMIDTEGGHINYNGRRISDHRNLKIISASQIIYLSSNIGIIKLIDAAYGNNPSRFIEGLEKIGLTQKLDVDIPGMATPIIPRPGSKTHYFSKVSLGSMSFGYETGIPPLQLLTFYNALANNGKQVLPRFAERLERDGEIIQEFPVKVRSEQIASTESIKTMQRLLRGVFLEGTAKNANSKALPLAGKTGTARIAKGEIGHDPEKTRHRHSFCGYFPADNPAYSCIIVMRRPKSLSSGATCASTFKEIAEQIFTLKSGRDYKELSALKPTPAHFIKRTPKEFPNDSVQTVPSVKGMRAKEAIYQLEKRGLRVGIEGYGIVMQQSIAPGSSYRHNQTIVLKLQPLTVIQKHENDTTRTL